MNRPLVIVYSNLGLGGIPIQIMDIANTMSKTKVQSSIYIILKEHRDYDIRSSIHNSSVTYLNFYDHCPIDNGLLFMFWTWYQIYRLNPTTILSFISPYGLTVLATKMLFFWRKTRILINEAHFTSTVISTMSFSSLQKIGVRLLYPIANTIIVPTKAVNEDLYTRFNIPKSKMVIIANWSRYATSKYSGKKRPFDIIYTGRIEKSKNILELLEICSNLISTSFPRLRCLIIGEGTYTQECLDYIKKYNLQNNVSIKKPVINISRFLRKAKIFVFMPNMRTEGFPISLLDAISLGAIVITTKFDGVREVLNNSNSIIVQTQEDMIQKIAFALKNYNHIQKRMLTAKTDVMKHYSIQNAVEYVKLFNLK